MDINQCYNALFHFDRENTGICSHRSIVVEAGYGTGRARLEIVSGHDILEVAVGGDWLASQTDEHVPSDALDCFFPSFVHFVQRYVHGSIHMIRFSREISPFCETRFMDTLCRHFNMEVLEPSQICGQQPGAPCVPAKSWGIVERISVKSASLLSTCAYLCFHLDHFSQIETEVEMVVSQGYP